MDDEVLDLGINAMTSSSPTRATLSTLPIEVLDEIFWLVHRSDLVNLRYVSKYICAVANRPFAVRNFRTRRHVVTEHSLKALLAISAHETFGAYFKNILLSPARALSAALGLGHSEKHVVDDSFVQSGRFSDLMQKVLSNLKQHSDSIAIGVHEDYCMGHGSLDQRFMGSERQVSYGERALCEAAKFGTVFQTSETLELLLAEMQTAAISVNGLSIEFAWYSGDPARLRTHKAIKKVLGLRNASIDLRFLWDCNGLLEYKHSQKLLRFSESSLLLDRLDHRNDVLFLDDIVQQLADKSLLELCLRDIDVGHLASLDMYFTQSLQTITLDELALGSIFFAENLYSNTFDCLSELPDLRHCKLHKLHYVLQDQGPRVMQTRSGTYRSRWIYLLLVFPNGKFEFEIQGADMSQRLKDLAAYTAAAERKKIQETETIREIT
ncbi:hypothetical protein KCU91_g9721, partial [Aureobasidium melanogenum]